jgi:hypothetical protein
VDTRGALDCRSPRCNLAAGSASRRLAASSCMQCRSDATWIADKREATRCIRRRNGYVPRSHQMHLPSTKAWSPCPSKVLASWLITAAVSPMSEMNDRWCRSFGDRRHYVSFGCHPTCPSTSERSTCCGTSFSSLTPRDSINPFAYLVDVLSRLGEHPVYVRRYGN